MPHTSLPPTPTSRTPILRVSSLLLLYLMKCGPALVDLLFWTSDLDSSRNDCAFHGIESTGHPTPGLPTAPFSIRQPPGLFSSLTSAFFLTRRRLTHPFGFGHSAFRYFSDGGDYALIRKNETVGGACRADGCICRPIVSTAFSGHHEGTWQLLGGVSQ